MQGCVHPCLEQCLAHNQLSLNCDGSRSNRNSYTAEPKHCAEGFTLNPHIMFILQMRKLRHQKLYNLSKITCLGSAELRFELKESDSRILITPQYSTTLLVEEMNVEYR